MAAAKKSAPRKATAKKAPAKKAPAKKAPAKKSPAKKSTASKTTAKKAPAKKSAPRKAAAKKAPAKKTAAKRTSSKTTARGAGSTSTRKNTTNVTKTATDAKANFDKKFLDQQRVMLLEERSRYIQSAESLKAEADSLIEGREPGDVQFDEEGGEGDTLAVERERDLALSAHARAAVEEIDAALARLDAGTYGICVVSGLPIPKERLEAIPWASERVEYKAGGFGARR